MARIGLLVCDHVPPEFRGVTGDYLDMFEELFSARPHIDLVPYDLPTGEFPASVDECEGWVTTGSRRSVYEDEPWIGDLAELVRDIARAETPYVGVCFGHQMIAQALGGKVERAEAGWGVGAKDVEVPDPPGWLGRGRYRILNSHADQIVDPPPGAMVLGGNDHCSNSLMQVGASMVGIQGHPEFTPELCEALIRSRRGTVIPEEVAEAALASLATPPDNEALADALADFLARTG